MPFADDDLSDSTPQQGELSYDEVRSECAALPAGQLWEDRRFYGDQARAPRRTPPRYAAATR